MTNWIAANVVSWVFKATSEKFVNYAETKVNFIKKTATNGVKTLTLGLDKLFGNSYMDIGIFIAIIAAIALYIIMNKTTFGYELKACGFNKHASKYAGMNEKKYIVLSMAIAGGLAAAGAALWCLNGAQDIQRHSRGASCKQQSDRRNILRNIPQIPQCRRFQPCGADVVQRVCFSAHCGGHHLLCRFLKTYKRDPEQEKKRRISLCFDKKSKLYET